MPNTTMDTWMKKNFKKRKSKNSLVVSNLAREWQQIPRCPIFLEMHRVCLIQRDKMIKRWTSEMLWNCWNKETTWCKWKSKVYLSLCQMTTLGSIHMQKWLFLRSRNHLRKSKSLKCLQFAKVGEAWRARYSRCLIVHQPSSSLSEIVHHLS